MTPSPDQLLLLHRRLLDGDRVASEELARLLLAVLAAEVHGRYPKTDEQLIADAVTAALLDYFAAPDQFDADRGPRLDRFLALAAIRNVINLRVGEQRRKRREERAGRARPESDVALDPAARNILREDREAAEAKRAALLAALADPTDREIASLQLDGVRDNDSFARVLGIMDQPIEFRQAEVKRHKDRINRFLRRKGLL